MSRIQSLILKLIPDYIGHRKCHREKVALENIINGLIKDHLPTVEDIELLITTNFGWDAKFSGYKAAKAIRDLMCERLRGR